MNVTDYPAGHSMDTNWFAVDKDGNVAVFDSDQEGPVPVQLDRGTLFTDYLIKYANQLSPFFFEINMNEKVVNQIVNACTKVELDRIESEAKDEYPFFEGFLVLAPGIQWTDIYIEFEEDKIDQDFAICFSKTMGLYYLNDVHNCIQILAHAIHNNQISGALQCDLNWHSDENEDGTTVEILNIFRYSCDWGSEPYTLRNAPAYPMNISQFMPGAVNKAVWFPDISFLETHFVQPLQYFPCHTWDSNRETKDHFLKKGYAKVLLNDKKTTALCAVSIDEWIENNLKVDECGLCDPAENAHYYDRTSAKTFVRNEHPKVLFLSDFEFQSIYWLAKLQPLSDLFSIPPTECYVSACIKCVKGNLNTHDVSPIFKGEIYRRFNNCYRKLEIEIGILQPLLIIGSGKSVYNLLRRKFNIPMLKFKYYKMSTVQIGGRQIPILFIDPKLLSESGPNDQKFENLRCDIVGILDKPHDLPSHPQVLPL